MPQAVLTADRLCKSYLSGNRSIEILTGVDFAVNAGESVSIRGESGSGKSTLLNLFAGLDAPDSGSVRWGEVTNLTPVQRAKTLGIVFQSFYLIPELDALQNVLIAARISDGRVTREKKQRAWELLQKVGLSDRKEHLPTQLSGGERQRVAVARALINRPALLLADEPTGNLDERTGDAVIELLLQLTEETQTALVLVTHNVVHAAKTSRKYLLSEGKLKAVGV